MSRAVSFNSNSLQTSNILLANIRGDESIPDHALEVYALAHGNASKIPISTYPSRTITISGKVIDTGIDALDSRLDTFKSYFVGQDKNLDITYNGATRRYIATANRVDIDRPYGLAFANFNIEFICTEPFGRDTSTTTAVTASGRTSASYSDNYTFLGTAIWQQPIFTVTYTALTGGTNKTVTIGNANTGQQVSITRTFSSSDVLVINAATNTITVNGIEVDFSGSIPEFQTGAQTIDYSDTLTTRTFDYTVTYYKRYM